MKLDFQQIRLARKIIDTERRQKRRQADASRGGSAKLEQTRE